MTFEKTISLNHKKATLKHRVISPSYFFKCKMLRTFNMPLPKPIKMQIHIRQSFNFSLMYHAKKKTIMKKRRFQQSFTKDKVQVSVFRDKTNTFKCIFLFPKIYICYGVTFYCREGIGEFHSQCQGNNIYNLKFKLMGSNRSRPYDLKVSNFLFSKNK